MGCASMCGGMDIASIYGITKNNYKRIRNIDPLWADFRKRVWVTWKQIRRFEEILVVFACNFAVNSDSLVQNEQL